MTDRQVQPPTLLYPVQTLRSYFRVSTDAQIAHFEHSIAAANEFLLAHPPETLAAGGRRPKGLGRALQYFKDEMFLTLYAFVSLDLGGSEAYAAERERLFTELLRIALPGLDIDVVSPELELEKQVSPPAGYTKALGGVFADDPEGCHPVWYLRLLGSGNRSPEGATHADAILTYADDRRVMFEAKFLSDISTSTTYAPDRDQLSRNLDAGIAKAGFDLERFSYVFVTPQRFRDDPQSRFYGYKLNEYMDSDKGPLALARDLPHLAETGDVDFAELQRHIGWITWEEICTLLVASPVFRSPEFPREGFEHFFRERCLWPDAAGCRRRISREPA